jgi:hypothetical protein
MWNSADSIPTSLHFNETSRWHEDPFIAFWQWKFCDLHDEDIRQVLSDLMIKIMLNIDAGYMTAEELEILRVGSLIASAGGHASTNLHDYDT